MGSTVGSLSTYTMEEVEVEIAKLTPHLPMAVLMNGGIIKVEGANGFFNPNSLLDPSWLKGKMTVQEYQQAIDYINKCAAHTHVGLTKMFNSSERVMRLNLKAQAGMKAVEEINQQHKDVRFTYQLTAQNIQMDISWELEPAQRVIQQGTRPVARSTLTILYIAVN